MKNNVTPALFTVDEACAFLGIQKSKVYALMADGTLRSAKLGRRRMFRRVDSEEYVATLFDDECDAA